MGLYSLDKPSFKQDPNEVELIPTYKVGDMVLVNKFIMEIIEINPMGFKNMYLVRNPQTGHTSFKNFSIVEKKCEIASEAAKVLYGKK